MFYYLYHFSHRSSDFEALNVFRYESFRAFGAAATALLFSWLFGPGTIRMLTRLKLGQPLRSKEEVRQLADLHNQKKGTPTMGGILILGTVFLSSALWCRPDTVLVWLVLGSMIYLGFIGFLDDYAKVKKKNSRGLTGKQKLAAQLLLATIVFYVLNQWTPDAETYGTLHVPFFKEPIHLYWLFSWIFFALVILGSSNAVNLTDGLDGLAIGCTITVAITYAIFCYLEGNIIYSTYLFLPPVPQGGELAVLCAALVGSGLGFLWYNCHPARVFMGDTGSLALGGTLAVIAIASHQELILTICGAVFVLEALSVMLQVASFKLTGKRIFAMSPLHHHFELNGWNESTVTIRFWILSLVGTMLSLATLKLR